MWVYFGLGVGGFFFLIGIGRFIAYWMDHFNNPHRWEDAEGWGEGWKEWIFYGSVLLLLTHIAFPESL